MDNLYIRENILQDIKGYFEKTKEAIGKSKDELQFQLLKKLVQTGASPHLKKLNDILVTSFEDIKTKYPLAFKIVISILSKKLKRTPDSINTLMQNDSVKSLTEKINVMTQFFNILFPSNQ